MRGLERDRPLGTKVTFWKLLRFFLPLGATPFLIASTHSIVDGALARLPNPEVNIAVFGIVKSMVNVIKAPELMSTQVFLAFVDDQKSYRLVRRFNWQVISVVFFLLSLLGYTPLGGLVLQYVFKIDDPDQLDLAYRALRIAAFLPFVETLRNAYQGMAVGLVRTGIMAVATAMRVVVLFFFLSWVVAGQVFTGIEAGSIAWVAGIGFELLIILSYFVWSFGSLSRGVTHLPSKDHGELTMGMVRNFFIPLGVMSLIAALIPSVIQAGIARFSLAPAEDLAGYAVALSLMTVIVGPARSLHQCLFVYGADEEGVEVPVLFAGGPCADFGDAFFGPHAPGKLGLWVCYWCIPDGDQDCGVSWGLRPVPHCPVPGGSFAGGLSCRMVVRGLSVGRRPRI